MTDITVMVIGRLMELKKLAEAGTPGPWMTPGSDTVGEWMIYGEKWAVAHALVNHYLDSTAPLLRDGINGDQANINAAHIASWNPEFALRWITWGIRLVERHHRYRLDDWERLNLNYACDACGEDWPCTEFKGLMEILGIEGEQ